MALEASQHSREGMTESNVHLKSPFRQCEKVQAGSPDAWHGDAVYPTHLTPHIHKQEQSTVSCFPYTAAGALGALGEIIIKGSMRKKGADVLILGPASDPPKSSLSGSKSVPTMKTRTAWVFGKVLVPKGQKAHSWGLYSLKDPRCASLVCPNPAKLRSQSTEAYWVKKRNPVN